MVVVPIAIDEYAIDLAKKAVKEGGAYNLFQMLPLMAEIGRWASLISSSSHNAPTGAIPPGSLRTRVSLWTLRFRELGGQEGESLLEKCGDKRFEQGRQIDSLRLQPYEQAHVRLSIGAGGVGLSSTVSRCLSTS